MMSSCSPHIRTIQKYPGYDASRREPCLSQPALSTDKYTGPEPATATHATFRVRTTPSASVSQPCSRFTHVPYNSQLVLQMNMPPSVQREVLSQMEPSEDEADGDDTDSDTDSHSSEDSAAWGPKQASQQPGSSAASTSARSTAPAAARPAAPKPAASKFGFKSGFLTGTLLVT